MVHKFVYHAVFCVYLYPTTGLRTCRDYRDGVFLEDPVFKIWLSR